MTIEERNKRVEENLKLVTYSLTKLGVSFNEDYFQQGVLELIRCVENYDESKGLKFSTYAVKNLKYYLKEYIARDKVLKPKRYGGTAKVYAPPCESFEKVVHISDGNDVRLADVIGDEDRNIVVREFMTDLEMLVDKHLMNNIHLQVLLLTYRDGFTKKQVAEKLGLSTKAISTIISEALLVIRDNLSYNDYDRR
ncbi:MAG: sigma-70 family RNA polymerase sigma factor [Romboutsia timonensis]